MAKGTVGAGVDTSLSLDDAGGGTLRIVQADTTKVAINTKGHGLVDVTAMGDAGHSYASDELEDCSFTAELWFNDVATTGSWTVVDGLRTATETASFEIHPFGDTVGYPELTGECWLEDCNVDMTVADIVKLSASFKVHGALTVGTAA
ncbi:MAG: hypothetical protein SVY53_12145 [Chloroflexota bacterium]|nr:hypothetical protein [Chloroflexota bacterium]